MRRAGGKIGGTERLTAACRRQGVETTNLSLNRSLCVTMESCVWPSRSRSCNDGCEQRHSVNFAVIGSVVLPSQRGTGAHSRVPTSCDCRDLGSGRAHCLETCSIGSKQQMSMRTQAVEEGHVELNDSGRQRPNGCGAGSARPWRSSSVWLGEDARKPQGFAAGSAGTCLRHATPMLHPNSVPVLVPLALPYHDPSSSR